MERLTGWTGSEWIPWQVRPDGKLVGYKDCMARLAEYENTGLTPDQIRGIDKLYQEKCKELAAAKDALEKLQEPEWKRRMLRTFLGSRGGDVK